MTAAFRKVATQARGEFDPRKFLKPAMDAMRDLCRDRLERFGTAGNASKIRVIAMDEMAKRYAAGKLDAAAASARKAGELQPTAVGPCARSWSRRRTPVGKPRPRPSASAP